MTATATATDPKLTSLDVLYQRINDALEHLTKAEEKDAATIGKCLRQARKHFKREESDKFYEDVKKQCRIGRAQAGNYQWFDKCREMLEGDVETLPRLVGVAVPFRRWQNDPVMLRDEWRALLKKHGEEPTVIEAIEFVRSIPAPKSRSTGKPDKRHRDTPAPSARRSTPAPKQNEPDPPADSYAVGKEPDFSLPPLEMSQPAIPDDSPMSDLIVMFREAVEQLEQVVEAVAKSKTGYFPQGRPVELDEIFKHLNKAVEQLVAKNPR